MSKEENLMQLYNELENERDIKIKQMLSRKLDKSTIENQKNKIADLETKLAEQQECSLKASAKHNLEMQNAQICIKELEAKLAESENKVKGFVELFDKKQHENYKQFCEIQQLKQQLAEKDLRIEELESQFAYECECNKQFVECQKQNEQLKQQLAEKEQELEDWKDGTIVVKLWHLERQLAEKDKEIEDIKDHQKDLCLRCGGLTHIEYEQDKISFCIEKLEKVKNKFNGKRPIDDLANEVGLELGYTATQIQKYIDNQIEELKKEMK